MTTDIASNAFKDRVVLVTGATQGIGREAALTLARHGATVVLLARSVKGLEKVYDEIAAAGGPEPAAVPLDLLKAAEGDFNNLAMMIKRELGRLDGILHCASHFTRCRRCPTRRWKSGWTSTGSTPWRRSR